MGGAATGRQQLRPPLLCSPPVRGELHVHPTQPVLPPGRRGAHPLPAAGAPCPQRPHREVLHQLLQQQGRQVDGERAPGPQARPPVSSGAGNQPQGTSLTLPHVLLTPPPTSCVTGEGFPLRPSPVTVGASPESDPLWPGSLCLTSLRAGWGASSVHGAAVRARPWATPGPRVGRAWTLGGRQGVRSQGSLTQLEGPGSSRPHCSRSERLPVPWTQTGTTAGPSLAFGVAPWGLPPPGSRTPGVGLVGAGSVPSEAAC